ncbi:MAG: hypothetical protein ACW986_19160 [Promethearchaeota archaeon]|jgi:hypothetical protein
MPTIDIDEMLKNQLKALKNIVGAKTYNEVVNLLIRRYDTESYYEPMLTFILDRLDTIENKINDIPYGLSEKKDDSEND